MELGMGVSGGLWSGVQIQKSLWKNIWESGAEMEGRRMGRREGGVEEEAAGCVPRKGLFLRNHLYCGERDPDLFG